jgi:hypothetical protein
MRIVKIETADLKNCIHDAQDETILIIRNGKPAAILVGVGGMDLEQVELGLSDKFWKLIRQRRGQKTLSRSELKKRIAER